MNGVTRIYRRGIALLLAGAMLPVGAQAQSVNDFKLPQGTSTPAPAPRSAGPVDPEQVVVLPRPRPTASATPAAPSASPTLNLPTAPVQPAATAGAGSAPAAAPQRRRAVESAVPSPARTAFPAATPSDAALAVPGAPDTAATPAAAPGFSFGQPAAPVTAPAPQPDAGWNWWAILAVLGAIAAAAFAAMWWRQRQAAPLAITFEPPMPRASAANSDPVPAAPVAPPEAPPAPQPAVPPAPTPEVPPAPVEPIAPPAPIEAPGDIPPESPAASAAAAAHPLVLALEARRLSASLMATTLTYRLVLTNTSAAPLSAVAVEGDMIGAHASLPPEQQLANRAENLELRHAAVSLAPGESVEFSGDLRLPLAAITPIRAGNAAYFVPLARFRVEASNDTGDQQVAIQTFVVGDQGEDPASPLRPFRLDLGPRTYSRIGQRAVA